ncbi:MAG TPA: flagellin FliC [Paenalcaligenes hominis]|uniref:Flagellin n=1 Tax=Paenalcaligenes hominis TaxID=643674 RepID=A0A9D2VEC5_9BURK|nr:flagellin FliC [Paenalcaligenes hominis]
MLSIHYNHHALLAQHHFAQSQSALGQAIERLSSGKRINSAKDDPAGFAIANRMGATIRGLNQASRNANDGISVAQTAEGALNEINYNVQRIRELTVQALNGSYNDTDRLFIQDEIQQRLEEIQRIADQTEFNGIHLLGAGAQPMTIQVGANDGQTIAIELLAMDVQALGLDGFTLSPPNGQPPTASPLAVLSEALNRIDGLRSHLGAIQNRFESVIRVNQTTSLNLAAARSRIEDTDYALEVSNMVRAQIQQQITASIMAQANQAPQLILKLLRDSGL